MLNAAVGFPTAAFYNYPTLSNGITLHPLDGTAPYADPSIKLPQKCRKTPDFIRNQVFYGCGDKT